MNIIELITLCGLSLHNFTEYKGLIKFIGNAGEKVIFKQYDGHVIVIIYGIFRIKNVFFAYDDNNLSEVKNAIYEVIAPF